MCGKPPTGELGARSLATTTSSTPPKGTWRSTRTPGISCSARTARPLAIQQRVAPALCAVTEVTMATPSAACPHKRAEKGHCRHGLLAVSVRAPTMVRRPASSHMLARLPAVLAPRRVAHDEVGAQRRGERARCVVREELRLAP